jgi:hypothetical protein
MCSALANVCFGPTADIAPPDGYPEDLLQPYQSRTALPPSHPAFAHLGTTLHSASLPCTVCGWRRADLRPDYSEQQAAKQSVGGMMPP